MRLKFLSKIGFVVVLSGFIISCQDLKLGDDFLAKPPAADLNIDDIYSNADYARRALWAAYATLPYGFNTSSSNKLGCDLLECLTDLNHSNLNWGSCGSVIYYNGTVTADTENSGNGTKYRYHGGNGDDGWLGIRRAYLFAENVDRVPDMTDAEKATMKAEAKMIVAIHYSEMFRHFGGLPWVDHAYIPTETLETERQTALQTMNNIVTLLDEAIAVLPWKLPESEQSSWDGRMTKAAAMALKARVLLFGASPLFNSATPYMEGEASEKHLTWHGSYMPELWERARKAHEDFFTEMQRNGGYALVDEGTNYRQLWRKAYFERNNGETVISTRRRYTAPGFWDGGYYFAQAAADYGTTGPTQEWVDMFPMVNGKNITEPDSGYDPDFPYRDRDPRLYESIVTNGDVYSTTRIAAVWRNPNGSPHGMHNQTDAAYGPWKTGYRLRKFILDGGGATQYETFELQGKVVHWPLLRLPELYYGYAEAICQTGGNMTQAYELVNAMRSRVGVGGMKAGLAGNDFVEAVLTERAVELAFEEVRWYDIIRYKREDILKKQLHFVEITRKDMSENPAVSFDFNYKELLSRYWARNFSPKWYLSAFASNEINKDYGLVQNPGW